MGKIKGANDAEGVKMGLLTTQTGDVLNGPSIAG
jgi:hypothetical protein